MPEGPDGEQPSALRHAKASQPTKDHWRVRALTRSPEGKKARALAELGAEVVKADLSDPVPRIRRVRPALDRWVPVPDRGVCDMAVVAPDVCEVPGPEPPLRGELRLLEPPAELEHHQRS